METSPPVKPPRGVKPSKETSGLLMSVIRTLSASETNEQRDTEKQKIEEEHKRSDKKLDELVSKHDQDLTKVMHLFGTLSTHVNDSRENIRRVKENLESCKVLLHCRRDELKKLWSEGLEYKYMLQLLEEIEQMSEVPNKVSGCLSRKHYLHATQLLVNAVSLGKGSLQGVKGIQELSDELNQRNQQLHSKLLEELRNHLYVKPCQEAVAFRRQGSSREAPLLTSPFQRSTEQRLSNRQRSNAKRNLFDISQIKTEEFKDFDVKEDEDSSDPEADSSNFMMILVKCLVLLEKIPAAVEFIKQNMLNELLSIVHRTTLQVNELITVQQSTAAPRSNAHALLELVHTLFDEFRCVGQAHATLLGHLKRSVDVCNIADTNLYDMKDFWAKIQEVLKILLTDYLDIQNISSESQLTLVYNDSNDFSSYFSRRKVQNKKKGPLFKFDSSSSALTKTSHMKNDGSKSRGQRDKVLVCSPDTSNITVIFVPLMCFIEEIEHATAVKSGNKCALNAFLSDYMTEKFLGQHKANIQAQVDGAVRVADAWKATTLPDTIRDSKPLLQSTVVVERCMQESRELMRSLPLYGERILKDLCSILRDYKETCLAAYRGIVQPHPEDRRICSAAWLKDEDISRFLKSLPNWLNLKSQQESQARIIRHGVERAPLRREHTEEESPEDVRLRNLREAEILASNLGEGGIGAQEIISDMASLRGLAQLQETMEWFAVRVLRLANEFRFDPGSAGGAPVSAATLAGLTAVGQEFDELANTCLLVLHLEVRVQCFHYLLAHSEYNRETQEPDPKVLELSRVLGNVDEAMSSCLHPRKCKYIFEGLGHLIAKILISSSQFMDQIDEMGIQRMCRNVFALQQTLTNITMARELALDHAKRYFELFYLTPEEILSGIMEKGQEFTELEYMNAFQLLNRSQVGKDTGTVNVHLERLSDILGEVGVTV